MGRGNEEEYLLGEKTVAEEPSECLLIHLSKSLSIEPLQMEILRKVFQDSGPLTEILRVNAFLGILNKTTHNSQETKE